jgi:hypothetical protein
VFCLIVLLAACSGPTQSPPDAEPAAATGGESAGSDTVDSEGAAAQPVAGGTDTVADAGDADPDASDEQPDPEAGDAAVDEGAEEVDEALDDSLEPTATPIREPISAITSTLTYVDPEIGYAMDYPDTWTIDSTPGSIVTLRSFDPAEPGRGGLMPQDSRIDIVPDLAEAGPTSLAQLVATMAQAGNEISREELELEGGVPAVRLYLATTASPTGEAIMLLAVIDGRGIRVQGFGDNTLFDSIALTLRPAE